MRYFLLFTLILGFSLPVTLFAEEDEVDRVVVIGKDTQLVKDSIQDMDDSLEIRGQGWFLKQVKSRALKPRKLFSRPKDFAYILKVTKTDFVITISPEGKTSQNIKIFDSTGGVVQEFTLKKKGNGVTKKGAEKIREIIATLFNENVEEESVEENESSNAVETPNENESENEDLEKEDEKANTIEDASSSSGVTLELGGAFVKRDFEVDSPSGAILAYNSNFYPGLGLEFKFFMGDNPSRWGVFLKAIGAFDSVAYQESGATKKAGLLHIDAELGTEYQFTNNSELEAGLFLSAKHVRFQLESSALPTTSYSTLNIGGNVEFKHVFPEMSVKGELAFRPFGLFHEGRELFGESSYLYGLAIGTRLKYEISDLLSLFAAYRMGLVRSVFSGAGKTDFSDSHAFDFTQVGSLGVGIQF